MVDRAALPAYRHPSLDQVLLLDPLSSSFDLVVGEHRGGEQREKRVLLPWFSLLRWISSMPSLSGLYLVWWVSSEKNQPRVATDSHLAGRASPRLLSRMPPDASSCSFQFGPL